MAENSPSFVRQWRPTSTFSSAVMLGNRRMFWNVRASPAAVTSCGFPDSAWPR